QFDKHASENDKPPTTFACGDCDYRRRLRDHERNRRRTRCFEIAVFGKLRRCACARFYRGRDLGSFLRSLPLGICGRPYQPRAFFYGRIFRKLGLAQKSFPLTPSVKKENGTRVGAAFFCRLPTLCRFSREEVGDLLGHPFRKASYKQSPSFA